MSQGAKLLNDTTSPAPLSEAPLALAPSPVVAKRKVLRLIPALDQSPELRKFIGTHAGRAFLAAWSAALLYTMGASSWWLVALVVVATPIWRRFNPVCTLALTIAWPFFGDAMGQMKVDRVMKAIEPGLILKPWGVTLVGFGIAAVFMAVASALARTKTVKQYLFTIHVVLFTAFFVNTLYQRSAACWLALLMWERYFWYFSYVLRQASSGERPKIFKTLATFRPMWVNQFAATGSLPMGKAGDLTWRYYQTDADSLAATQLKGIKLLTWAAVLYLLKLALMVAATKMMLPTLSEALTALSRHAQLPLTWRWICLIWNFMVYDLLEMAITGHIVIGTARLLGFMMPRQMARPVGATNLVDFYNRYLYYFKEILNDFFFMPSFLMFRKLPVQARTVAATFVTIGLGNVFYHLMYGHVVTILCAHSPSEAFSYIAPYFAVYFSVLAVGLSISQLRRLRGRKRPKRVWHLALAQVSTVMFFVMLSIFGLNQIGPNIGTNWKFFLSLWGF